jgi:HPt (histidine-containing phosphotransfer) domain-containing protein
MTRPNSGDKSWTTPAAAQAACRDLLADVIPGLSELSVEYRVDADLLDAELYGLFCDQMRQMLAGMGVAAAASDEMAIRRYAHSLEGMGGTMGFPEISVAAVTTGRAAREHNWDRCRILIERLTQWLKVAVDSASESCHE